MGNIGSGPKRASLPQGTTFPLEGGWDPYLVSPKGEVLRWLEQFFHSISGRLTLNLDLVLHSLATWAP